MSASIVATPGVDESSAYAHCRRVARRRARNFYYGLRLTPEPKRSAVYSVYAWMRHGDDLVDEVRSPGLKRRRLEAFRADTERLLSGAPIGASSPSLGDPAMWLAFARTIERFDVDPEDIRAMLAGLEEDIEGRAYRNEEDLHRYCARVASSVGRVCVRIWGLRDGASSAKARRRADQRGVAFQMTNILRDYREDFDEGRVYLPVSDFDTHALTPADLRVWDPPGLCEAFVRDRAAAARRAFEESEGLEDLVAPDCAPTLWAMTRIYSGLLEKIEERPSRIVGDTRIRLHSFHKAGIAVRAVARSRRGAW